VASSSEWREVWRYDDHEAQQSANLTQLTRNGEPVPGALVLSVNDGGDEGWTSVPYGALRDLRDALNDWLAEVAR
jgi:hypothetical protein